MKKFYENQLPKNAKVSNVRVYINNNKLVTEFDLKCENEFNPKDGDFLTSAKGCIFIYRENYGADNCYGCYCGIDMLGIPLLTSSVKWTSKTGCRYATAEEKDYLLKKLEEKNKRWNAETKQLEDIVNPNEKLSKEFEELTKSLIDFINKNYHPHCTIIIKSDGAELLEGLIGFSNKDNL